MVCQLHGGLTNQSFLVADGDDRAVVRINRQDSYHLGIDRQREISVHRALADATYVPDVLLIDAGVQVSHYIAAQTVTAEMLQTPTLRRQALHNLAQIHALALPDAARFSYLRHCQVFARQLPAARLRELDWTALAVAAHAIDNAEWTPVLCHHDLVVENILLCDRGLFFIDWEYAGFGHPAFDAVKLFGADGHIVDNYGRSVPLKTCDTLAYLQQGMEKIWYAVQD